MFTCCDVSRRHSDEKLIDSIHAISMLVISRASHSEPGLLQLSLINQTRDSLFGARLCMYGYATLLDLQVDSPAPQATDSVSDTSFIYQWKGLSTRFAASAFNDIGYTLLGI